jgi:ribosomal protein S14
MINFNKSQKRRLLLVEYLKRKHESKNELKKKILKTLEVNKNQQNTRFFYINSLYNEGNSITFNKQQNRCLYTGRIKGFQKKTRSSRQALKKFAVFGSVQNLKKKS